MLLCKLQNATEKSKIIERLVLWYEFDSHGKFSHVKLLIKGKLSTYNIYGKIPILLLGRIDPLAKGENTERPDGRLELPALAYR